MPGLSGLEVAAQLEPDTAPMLVFVTAHDEHAIKAFELNAVDYLLKPYDRDRFDRTLARLRGRRRGDGSQTAAIRAARARTGNADRLLVSRGDELRLIEATHILWLEADDNYVHVHTADARFLLRRTLDRSARATRRPTLRAHPQIHGGESLADRHRCHRCSRATTRYGCAAAARCASAGATRTRCSNA